MIKNKNVCLIISVIIAILWMCFSIYTMCDASTGLNSEDSAKVIGTGLGMVLLMPYLIVSSIGVILHTIGGFTYIKGLVLAGLITECVGLLLGITWGFGYVAAIVLGFIGFAKMTKNNI